MRPHPHTYLGFLFRLLSVNAGARSRSVLRRTLGLSYGHERNATLTSGA